MSRSGRCLTAASKSSISNVTDMPSETGHPWLLSIASDQAKVCGTTPRQMQTSTQQSSILQSRLAVCARGCQGYPTTRWADATAPSAVANCIRYRNTIVPGRVPFPTTVPNAWQARAIQPLGMCGKGPFPFRDWQRCALSCQ